MLRSNTIHQNISCSVGPRSAGVAVPQFSQPTSYINLPAQKGKTGAAIPHSQSFSSRKEADSLSLFSEHSHIDNHYIITGVISSLNSSKVKLRHNLFQIEITPVFLKPDRPVHGPAGAFLNNFFITYSTSGFAPHGNTRTAGLWLSYTLTGISVRWASSPTVPKPDFIYDSRPLRGRNPEIHWPASEFPERQCVTKLVGGPLFPSAETHSGSVKLLKFWQGVFGSSTDEPGRLFWDTSVSNDGAEEANIPITPFFQKYNTVDSGERIANLKELGAAEPIAPCPVHNFPYISASNHQQTAQNTSPAYIHKYYFQASTGASIRRSISSMRQKVSRECFFIQLLSQVGFSIYSNFKFSNQSRNSYVRLTGRPRALNLYEASLLFKILHRNACPFFLLKSALTSNTGGQPQQQGRAGNIRSANRRLPAQITKGIGS